MRRTSIVVPDGLALTASVAVAAKVHNKPSPTFSDQGLALSASGALAGLGDTP
jgi:hypothetical protein